MLNLLLKFISPQKLSSNVEEQGRSRIYIVYLLIQFFAVFIVLMLNIYAPQLLGDVSEREQSFNIISSVLISYTFLFLIAKFGHYKISVYLYILLMNGLIFYTFLTLKSLAGIANVMCWLAMVVIVASITLSMRQTVYTLVCSTLTYLFILSHANSDLEMGIAIGHFLFFISSGLMILAGVYLRELTEDKLEKERASNESNARLTSLGEMAGSIAHEINTPLAAISMHSQMLLQKAAKDPNLFAPENLKKIDAIYLTSQRIAKIIKSLRFFSRDGSADQFQPVAVKHVIDVTLDLCQEACRKNSINLDVNDFSSDIVISGREVQLSQVILNLVTNSLDAIKELPVKWIKINVEKFDSDVVIKVLDSGSGIPDHILQNIFNPFYTTKEVGKGTGLGLSISKGIIEQHKGQLVYDKTEKNTCFKIILPCHQQMKEAV